MHLWNTNEDFRNKITEIWEKIKAIFERLTSGIVDRLNALGFNFEDFGDLVKSIWQGLCDILAPWFEGVFTYIAKTFDVIVDVILGILDIFIGLFTGDWEQMQLTMNSGMNLNLDGISSPMKDGSPARTIINNYNNDNSRTVNQTNNSPKSLSRLEIYRQTRNALKT